MSIRIKGKYLRTKNPCRLSDLKSFNNFLLISVLVLLKMLVIYVRDPKTSVL